VPPATGQSELTNQTVVKATVLLAVYGTALAFGTLVYESYRYNNVNRITVSKLVDLDEAFKIGPSSLRVKNPEFLKICFTGDYVYALKDARQWFAADDTEFMLALEAAGGPADVYTAKDKHRSFCSRIRLRSSCNLTGERSSCREPGMCEHRCR
jgi:hypothetical protein